MKIKLNTLIKTLLLSLLVFFFSACHNLFNNDNEEPVNEYLASYENVKSYLPVFMNQAFDQLSEEYPAISPAISPFKERVEHGIMVYKITYYTTFQDKPKLASGLVCVPMGEGPFPVMSYQNGTNTLHSNAPSVNPNNELYLMLEFVASAGFVISIPDYLGFGASDNMFHPYMDKESTVQSVLDMLRAVDELASNYLDIELKNDLYISGYSQGGWATMQVQKAIEQQFSNEFNLKASACGAGPYDLDFINEYILSQTEYPMPYFAGYILNSYTNLGEVSTPIDTVFNEPYAGKISSLYNGSRSGEEINAELATSVEELFNENYIENYKTDTIYSSILETLEANSISVWATSVPTRIYHGSNDNFVPAQLSQNIYQDFRDAGVSSNSIELFLLPELDHRTGIIPAGLASVNWFLELTE